MRAVSKDDIDWRNTALITKFLNDQGKLYNRYQTRLPTNVQRKVAKVVKKARNLGLLPYVGHVKPTDKISLGDFIEDVEEMHKKTIDPVTGRLFLKHSLQDDARDKARRAAKKLEKAADDESPLIGKDEQLLCDALIREMELDNDRMIPNRAQREWLSAQAFLLEKDGTLVSSIVS